MQSERSFTNSEELKLEEVRSRGTIRLVPSVDVLGRCVVVSGRLLRLAHLKDEEWVENSHIDAPDQFVALLRSTGLRADVFTFRGELDGSASSHPYLQERENAAVITTLDYDAWWNALPQEARKNVRRAAKRGVETRTAILDESLARGIKRIYDETPTRQGRHFWHYGKNLETVIRENTSYSERCEFIGAYFEGKLIGFMKWVYVGDVARIMQILALNAHQDQRPMHALIAKAVEICHRKGARYLIYSQFSWGQKGDDSMTEFKRRMGFTQIDYSRYFVPLNRQGAVFLRLGLHRGLMGVMPRPWIRALRALRARWLSRRSTVTPP